MDKKPIITYKNKSGVAVTLRGNDAVVWMLGDMEKRLAILESAAENNYASKFRLTDLPQFNPE